MCCAAPIRPASITSGSGVLFHQFFPIADHAFHSLALLALGAFVEFPEYSFQAFDMHLGFL
jgi:hypothetical protein